MNSKILQVLAVIVEGLFSGKCDSCRDWKTCAERRERKKGSPGNDESRQENTLICPVFHWLDGIRNDAPEDQKNRKEVLMATLSKPDRSGTMFIISIFAICLGISLFLGSLQSRLTSPNLLSLHEGEAVEGEFTSGLDATPWAGTLRVSSFDENSGILIGEIALKYRN